MQLFFWMNKTTTVPHRWVGVPGLAHGHLGFPFPPPTTDYLTRLGREFHVGGGEGRFRENPLVGKELKSLALWRNEWCHLAFRPSSEWSSVGEAGEGGEEGGKITKEEVEPRPTREHGRSHT